MENASEESSTSDKQHPVKVERFQRNLKVALTEAQQLDRARRAAEIAGEVGNKEAERDAAKKHVNAQIEELQAEQQRLNGEIRDRATYKDVACERRFNYRLGTVGEYRTDTNELIPGTERALSDRERQIELGLPGNGNGSGDIEEDFLDDDDDPDDEQRASQKGKKKAKKRSRGN